MPTDVVMPQMGESIFEGTITKWLKKAGDVVEKDEPLFEISTDKVDAEIPSPVAGVLSEIKIPAGATVEINTVVAVIGGAVTAATPAAATQTTPMPAVSSAKSVPPAQSAPPEAPQVTQAAALFAAGAAHREGEQPRPEPGGRDRIRGAHYQGRCAAARERHLRYGQLFIDSASFTAGSGSTDQDARHHRSTHGGEQADQPPRSLRLQGGHDSHRASARTREGPLRAAARRQAHLHAVHRRRRRAGADQIPHRQRLAHRRLHPLSCQHQSRHRRGFGVGVDCAGGQAGRKPQLS